jgi:hypothetical protein
MTRMQRREGQASEMAHENEKEAVLPTHVQGDRSQNSLEGDCTGKVPEGKERWSAESVFSREELEMEHETYKGVGSSRMERLL